MSGYNIISSPDNEKIKLYKRLSADKKLRRKEGLFTAEGARLVSDAASERIDIRHVLFTESALKKYGGAMDMLFERYDKRVFSMIPEELAKSLSETQVSQGIFAVLSAPSLDKSAVYDKIKRGGRALILDNIQDPGNMGTILRTADACGIDGVITCSCCDIYNPKTVRSAMGSIMRVPVIDEDITAAVQELKIMGIPIFAAVIGDNAVSLTDCDFSKGGAVIIGNEGNGLSEEDAALADIRLTIKMHGSVNSLNAAMAAGIIMWELSKK